MDFISLFAGVGGFDLGFEKAGMQSVAQVEWNDQATSVLKRHYPNVLHLGDVTHVGKHNLPAAHLVCGGFPCTDVSVAGRRAGLAGKSSGYWFEFHRIIHEAKPEWVVIENVPGLLSSNNGRDFAIILAGLTGSLSEVPQGGWRNAGVAQGLPGLYHAAWRVLDARYFGVAQRRRRVFIVANLTSLGGGCASVLFEQQGGARDIAQSRETRQGTTRPTSGGASSSIAKPLLAKSGRRDNAGDENFIIPTSAAHAQTYRIQRSDDYDADDTASTLAARDYKSATDLVAGAGHGVRRLTPTECERLQGFPDGWTERDHEGGVISDSARYRMLGNAVCANVAEWLGKRIVQAAAPALTTAA